MTLKMPCVLGLASTHGLPRLYAMRHIREQEAKLIFTRDSIIILL